MSRSWADAKCEYSNVRTSYHNPSSSRSQIICPVTNFGQGMGVKYCVLNLKFIIKLIISQVFPYPVNGFHNCKVNGQLLDGVVKEVK